MADNFDLDTNIDGGNEEAKPAITSVSLCTPGCVTGWLMCNKVTQGCSV
ncbi:MAG: gallidermin/nisin family lantibiotic [Luteococcus sp.]|nr:gallidermin/nisin family lantibiotic [Luteococcus sp.]MDN5562246.1 gallidermin/nisin family lantibiotic [Luteococcus sp.]